MSTENTILKALMEQKENAKNRINENTEQLIASLTSEEILSKFNKYIKESDDTNMKTEEEDFEIDDLTSDDTVDDKNDTMVDDENAEDSGSEEDDVDSETEAEETADEEMDDEEEYNSAEVEMGDEEEMDDEEETAFEDLTDASYDEVTQRIKDALANGKDGESITVRIVKKATYDMDSEVGENENSEEDDDTTDESYMNMDESVEESKSVEEQDCKTKMKNENPCWDGYEQIGTKTKDGKEVPNCVPTKNEAKKVVSEELKLKDKIKRAISEKNKIITLHENKLKKAKDIISKLLDKNKNLEESNAKQLTALKEAKELVEETMLVNTNLTNISKLFVENTISSSQKKTIIKEFSEKVTTVNESNLLFESYKKILQVKDNKPKDLPEKSDITNTEKGKIVTESKSFVKNQNQANSRFMELVNYKI